MPVRLALANQKGGVGKTTSAVNLAGALADGVTERDVLLVDMDPQGGATQLCGVQASERDLGWALGGLDEDRPPVEVVMRSVLPGVDLLPAYGPSMIAAENDLHHAVGAEHALRLLLSDLAAAVGEYRYVVIDTPSNLGKMTINGICACDWVCMPMNLEGSSQTGVGRIRGLIQMLQRRGLTSSALLGLVINEYEPRLALSRIIEQRLAHDDVHVFDAKIPRTVRITEATVIGRPVIVDAPDLPAAAAFRALAAEIVAAITEARPTTGTDAAVAGS